MNGKKYVPPADLYDALTAWADAGAAIDRHNAAIAEHAAEIKTHANVIRDLETRMIPVMRAAGPRVFKARGTTFGLVDGRPARLDVSLASEFPIPPAAAPDASPAPIRLPGDPDGRLVFDPNVSDDSPVVRGTWVTAAHVAALIVDGWTWSDILRSHPELVADDLRACLAYTAAIDAAAIPAAVPDADGGELADHAAAFLPGRFARSSSSDPARCPCPDCNPDPRDDDCTKGTHDVDRP